MAQIVIAPSRRLTVGLVERATGWAFRLHAEAGRCWLDSYEADVPVPTSHVAGRRAAELELLAGTCSDVDGLIAACRSVVAGTFEVMTLEALGRRDAGEAVAPREVAALPQLACGAPEPHAGGPDDNGLYSDVVCCTLYTEHRNAWLA
jgi:hypothetical protein